MRKELAMSRGVFGRHSRGRVDLGFVWSFENLILNEMREGFGGVGMVVRLLRILIPSHQKGRGKRVFQNLLPMEMT